MSYKYALFDLDGTLVNTKEGILNGFAYALDYLNIKYKDKEELKIHIGPPLTYTFSDYYKLDKDTTLLAVKKYREFYKDKGMYQCKLYDGINELLIKLKKQNIKIAVSTSKAIVFAEAILKKHNIYDYFNFISGSELDGSREKKEEVIKYALEGLGVKDKNQVIMIGDRCFDIEGARKNNIDSVGVLWGFGNEEEFLKYNSTYIVSNTNELFDVINKRG